MAKENPTLQRELFDLLDGAYWLDNSRYFACYCPIESHAKQALMVYVDGCWCASCNRSYSLEYIKSKSSSLPTSYRPTIVEYRTLPRWRQWEKRYGDLQGIADAAHKNLLKIKATYFKNRGLEGYIKKAHYGLMDGFAVIPVFDKEHNVIDIVCRSIKQQNVKYAVASISENEIRPLYCLDWDLVMRSQKVYVVFGIFDLTAFDILGLPCLTGITGKSINPSLFDEFPGKEFVIVPDRNEEKDAYKLASNLGWRGSVLRVNYPFKIKDMDELRRSTSPNEWKRLYEGEWSKDE
jgi:hypothetical protein